ncbi:beta-galactosidase trimerization domain-containing protein, partial [bacterium]|nr:beta-galactosidase trimerization domain-containing protein [bacterium]
SNGGIFIAGFRCAIKDENSNMLKEVLPGKLRDLFGIGIYAWDNIRDRAVEVRDREGKIYRGDTFADLITPEGAETLAWYNSGWYKEYSAVTVNNYGEGKAYYIGCGLSQEFYDWLMKELLSGYALKELNFPEEVEVNTREKDGKRFIFINNFSDKETHIEVKKGMIDLITERYLQGTVELGPFEVMVLEEQDVI